MNSNNFIWLGGGLAALSLVIALCMFAFGGLSSQVVQRAKMEKLALEGKQQTYDKQKSEIVSILDKNSELDSFKSRWLAAIKSSDAEMMIAKQAMEKAQKIIEDNDGDKENELVSNLDKLNSHRNNAVLAVANIHQEAVRASNFLTNRVEVTKQSIAKAKSAIGSSKELKSLINKAMIDWPEKKSDLNNRLVGLVNDEEGLDDLSSKLPEAEVVEAISIVGKIDDLAASINGQKNTIIKLVDQLYTSWDKMLVDMSYEESGWNMVYYHTYNIATIKIVPGSDNKFSEKKVRERVSEQYFDANSNNLGMVVASKPAGKYDHEISQAVQPPLYNRVAPPGHSNHYGRWDNGSWHWNEFMMGMVVGNMFSNNSYTIRESDYHDYDRSRRSNRPYYGRSSDGKPVFGSNGTNTQRTLGNAYRRTNTITQEKNRAKSNLQTRHTRHVQQQQARQRTSLGGRSSGSRYGGGK